MRPLSSYRDRIPARVFAILSERGIRGLRPCQVKAIDAGLFSDRNLLVCTPTASGKTLVAEMAALNGILHDRGKAVYIVPLRALASEKYKQFTRDYPQLSIGISTGDLDDSSGRLERHDLLVLTSEKFDSLLRHAVSWIRGVKTVIVDEVHLLNDPSRGPTVEVVLTIVKRLLSEAQIVALSATIGNKEELASWLSAELVVDDWRPVVLSKGVLLNNKLTFYE